MLSIQNLCKKFDTRTILNNVSLNVQAGEIAVLLGASGVGKSTLLRVLNNLETFDSGTIFLDDKLLFENSSAATNAVGMVFQQFNLFEHMTVLENITFALRNVNKLDAATADNEGHALLKHYNLDDKAHLYVNQLSGGQKQRLAIARTIARKPRIICMDEPTSALDPLLTNHVAQSIQELADQGYIVLVATHDTSLLQSLRCTIYLMEHGEIVASVNSELFNREPLLFTKIHQFVSGSVTS